MPGNNAHPASKCHDVLSGLLTDDGPEIHGDAQIAEDKREHRWKERATTHPKEWSKFAIISLGRLMCSLSINHLYGCLYLFSKIR